MRRALIHLVGIASFLPVVAVAVGVLSILLNNAFLAKWASRLLLSAIPLTLLMIIVFLGRIYSRDDLPEHERILWMVLLLMAGPLVEPPLSISFRGQVSSDRRD